MQRLIPALAASVLSLAPLGARAADLVVWWEKGFYEQEDAAVREIIAAFEQKTGKQVELVQPHRMRSMKKAESALQAGSRPTSCSATSSNATPPTGLTRTGWSTSRASSARSWTCSMPTPSMGPPCSTARRAGAAFMRCRWAGIPTTSMSGTASWSGPGSPLPTFPRSGRRSGRSGATRCSPRCARPWAATTSGASGCPCPPRLTTPTTAPAVRARLWHALARPRPPASDR